MLYIDQPYGAGFSTSSNTQHLNNTDSAAALVWKFLQVFYDQFPQYQSRDFGIWSESYSGRMYESNICRSLSFPSSGARGTLIGSLASSGRFSKKNKKKGVGGAKITID